MKWLKIKHDANYLYQNMVASFKEHKPVVYAASIAFFMIFSLPSILLITLEVASAFAETNTVRMLLQSKLAEMVGIDTSRQIEHILQEETLNSKGFFTAVLYILFIVFTATIVFAQIQGALNNIWNVRPKPDKSWKKFLADRAISFLAIIGLGVLMLVSLSLEAGISLTKRYFNQNWGSLDKTYVSHALEGLHLGISFLVLVFIFATVFKVLPDARIKWKDVLVGGVVTSLLFNLGNYLTGLFLRKGNITTTYGTAGSLVALLLWVFYSSIVLLVGAIFTAAWSNLKGRYILPKKHAVRLEIQEVESIGNVAKPMKVD